MFKKAQPDAFDTVCEIFSGVSNLVSDRSVTAGPVMQLEFFLQIDE